MELTVIEKSYPITFREEDAQILGDHIRLRHSVELVGMKRVGISNFLRFFLNHKEIKKVYIRDTDNYHLFIPVDLHDLIEQEVFPFWVLTFKRLVDAVEKIDIDSSTKELINTLFLNSVQLHDHFMTIENLKRAFRELISAGVTPTIFFIRFDRLNSHATKQLLENLQGLIDATNRKLSYVFTSFRPLDQLSSDAFPRASLATFSHIMYLCTAKSRDMKVIYESFNDRYRLDIQKPVVNHIIQYSGGHVQYLHLLMLIMNEKKLTLLPNIQEIAQDERVSYLFDELWESLQNTEQETLEKIGSGEKISKTDKEVSKYLWFTGFIDKKTNKIFSPLFEYFLKNNFSNINAPQKTSENGEFTKKEHSLFSYLEQHFDELCERDDIALHVWPEIASEGVSDWTIDRLIARVRNKLKMQKSPYSIVTVKTRGYKLVKGR